MLSNAIDSLATHLVDVADDPEVRSLIAERSIVGTLEYLGADTMFITFLEKASADSPKEGSEDRRMRCALYAALVVADDELTAIEEALGAA